MNEEAIQAPPVNSPTYIDNAVQQIRTDQERQIKETKAENSVRILADGSDSEFWKILKDRMESMISSMRNAESTRMGEGQLDLQSIGLRSIVINEISDAFTRVIHMVEAKQRTQKLDDLYHDEDIEPSLTLEDIETP